MALGDRRKWGQWGVWTVAWKGHSITKPSETSSVDTDPRKPVRGTCKHCINKSVVQMKTLFPTVIYHSQLFSWAKDVFTQVRITNSQFLRFCFYDRSWWIKHWKRMYNTIKLFWGPAKKYILCLIKLYIHICINNFSLKKKVCKIFKKLNTIQIANKNQCKWKSIRRHAFHSFYDLFFIKTDNLLCLVAFPKRIGVRRGSNKE